METGPAFERSTLISRPELNLFAIPPTDSSIISSEYFTFFPTTAISNSNAPIEIIVPPSQQLYTDFGPNSHFLYCKFSIVKADATKLAATDKVAGCHNLFAALFSSISVEINNNLVSRSDDGLYAYKKHIVDTLTHSAASKTSKLQSQLYFPDTSDTIDDANTGFTKRVSYFANSIDCEITGNLFEAVFQNRYFPTDCSFRIVLKRSDSHFHLDSISPAAKATDPAPFKLKWSACQLYVKRVLVNPAIVASHHKLLSARQKFSYPTQIIESRIFTASKDAQTIISEPLFRSTIPRILILTLLDPARFHGDIKKSPFRFTPSSLTSIRAMIDGVPIIFQNLEISSTNGLIGYNSIFNALDDAESGQDITRDSYLSGSFFVVLDMNPIQRMSKYLNTREGNVTVELRFAAPLTSSVMVMALGVFQGLITIDSNRIATLEADQH
ncbi:hypothetical protein Fcan01_28439 [Folsomia candida]|uniref:Uncharacterized protein n=1 Tax=Folsomia candida TaxID=158441 RepID=A0A226CVL6_FOLCA|nr:hypothetical protein Fcan01_28439 [Folsomia candida]